MKRKMCVAILFWLTTACLGQTVCPKHIETPTYPVIAAATRIQAKVSLRVTIDAAGHTTKTEVVNDYQVNMVLQESAMENIKHWTFEPPPSAPFTLMIVYEYKMDGSLPVNHNQNPITKIDFDLPDHVTIRHNESVWNPTQQKKSPKPITPR